MILLVPFHRKQSNFPHSQHVGFAYCSQFLWYVLTFMALYTEAQSTASVCSLQFQHWQIIHLTFYYSFVGIHKCGCKTESFGVNIVIIIVSIILIIYILEKNHYHNLSKPKMFSSSTRQVRKANWTLASDLQLTYTILILSGALSEIPLLFHFFLTEYSLWTELVQVGIPKMAGS